jgi:hypothetical protein
VSICCVGNCWSGNVSSAGAVTHDAALPLPACPDGSRSPIGNVTKSALMVSCATYNREDQPNPPGCDWFENPAVPAGRQEAPGQAAPEPAGRGETAPAPQPGTGGGAGLPAPSAVATVANARSLPATGAALLPALAGLALAGSVLHLRRRSRRTDEPVA